MCDCNNPDCALPPGRCALCEQPCADDRRSSEPEVCEACADKARTLRGTLDAAYGNLGPGWHVDDTGTPRLVRDDEAALFEDDDAAVAFVKRAFHALSL